MIMDAQVGGALRDQAPASAGTNARWCGRTARPHRMVRACAPRVGSVRTRRPHRGGLAEAREPGCASGSLAPSRGTRRHTPRATRHARPAGRPRAAHPLPPPRPRPAARLHRSRPIEVVLPALDDQQRPVGEMRDLLDRVDGADVLARSAAATRAGSTTSRAARAGSRPRRGAPAWIRPRGVGRVQDDGGDPVVGDRLGERRGAAHRDAHQRDLLRVLSRSSQSTTARRSFCSRAPWVVTSRCFAHGCGSRRGPGCNRHGGAAAWASIVLLLPP